MNPDRGLSDILKDDIMQSYFTDNSSQIIFHRFFFTSNIPHMISLINI